MTVAATAKRRRKQIKSSYAQLGNAMGRPIYHDLIKAHARQALTPTTRGIKSSVSA